MNELDYEVACLRCGDTGCDECSDPCDREEMDFARGICRECDTWGTVQCRIHADGYLEACRAEDELRWLTKFARRGKRTKASRRARSRVHYLRVAERCPAPAHPHWQPRGRAIP